MLRLLLHICCAPCGSYITKERLKPCFALTWYFYNPNIISQEEYDKRLYYVKLMAEKFSLPLLIEPYAHENWLAKVKGRENDPERGERCHICYRQRLGKAARLAAAGKYDFFSTTLLVSPYKDTAAIKSIGCELAEKEGIKFLDEDFQADDGYLKSQAFAKAQGIYRQKFCGCEYFLPLKKLETASVKASRK